MVGAMQITGYRNSENQAAQTMGKGARQISTGMAQSVEIDNYMTLYDANKRKGQARIQGLPISVARPIPGMTLRGSMGMDGTVHSRRWPQMPVGSAAWADHWTDWRGVLAFAPSAAIDDWNSIEYEVDRSGRSPYKRLDTDEFPIASARSQSGNAFGMAAGAVVFCVAVVPLLATVLISGSAA
ncbi:MAG: hypothetical protein JHC61_09465 [Burkholderiaceae bacterium]|nr:hypothetical protein [Burkholderiaceae bacterium]